MSKAKTLQFEGIGDVLVVPHRRAKRLSISVRPFRNVRVTVPPRTPLREAISLIEDNLEWIIESRFKAEQIESTQTIFTQETLYETRNHVLEIRREGAKRRKKIANGVIRVNVPIGEDLQSDETQNYIRSAVVETYRREAKELLPQRVFELSFQFGFRYREVFVRDTRSQWGSCSFENDISLSLHLVRLPDPLIDYVLLHELVHTEIKNHSPRFWRRLNEVTYGNARRLDKLMRGWKIDRI